MNHKKWARLIKERDKVCVICGSDKELSAHHIEPRSIGGKNTLGNGRLLCRTHHSEAHSGEHSTVALHKKRTGGAFDSRYTRAAAIIGVSQTTIYNRIYRGELPYGTCEEIVTAEYERIKAELDGIYSRLAQVLANPAES